MATLRNRRKLAAVLRDSQENARKGQSQNTFVPGMTVEDITQASEEIEGRITKKLFQEFSRTESRILVVLSKLDEFLLNPQVRTCSGTVSGTSRNKESSEYRESTRDCSPNDPYPDGSFLFARSAPQLTQAGRRSLTASSRNIYVKYPTFQLKAIPD